jgi:NTP pyrophosphatase (non-canonical NTP hydrolase)
VLIVDEKATIDELKKEVKRFNHERDWDQFHDAKELAIAISLEAAEVLEPFVYKSEKQVEEIMNGKKRTDIEDELADVFWAVLVFAERYNIDLSNAFKEKMKKTELKYPANKVRGSNKKYTEYD